MRTWTALAAFSAMTLLPSSGANKPIQMPLSNDTVLQEQQQLQQHCPNIKSPDVLLSRRRRALSFPEGSNFIVTVSLVKAILMGLPLGWNIALEIEMPYKSVGFKDLVKHKFPRLRLHSRKRRELLKGIEYTLSANGLNGQACVLRAICEVQYFLAPPNTYLPHDILRIMLKIPGNGGPGDVYRKASETKDCNVYGGVKKCPYSLLDIIINYGTVVR